MMRGRAIPIIKLYDTLIVSIQLELTDRLVLELKEEIASEVRRHDVRGLIIEVSGVDIFDSFIARSIRDIAHISSLMGVETVLAGLDAGMAITLVEMGMILDNVETALNLEYALERFSGYVAAREQADVADALALFDSDDPWLDEVLGGPGEGAVVHGDG